MKTTLENEIVIGCEGCERARECYKNEHQDDHHIYFGMSLRKQSEKWNCKAKMCHWRHQYDKKNSPHLNRAVRDEICAECQSRLEAQGWTRDEFREEFVMSYI